MPEIVLIGLGVVMVFLLAVNNRRTAKRRVVMIALATVVAVCIVVVHPRFSKSFSLSLPSDMWLKCGHSGLDVRELLFEKSMNISGPLGWNRVDTFKGREDSGSESRSGNGERIVTVRGKFETVTYPRHDESTTDTEQPQITARKGNSEDCHWFYIPFVGLFIGLMIGMFILFSSSHITQSSPGA
jgi:hypothetical protein